MMQKNERDLLEPWIAHHAHLFGFENLYIFDNGSSDPQTIASLRSHENRIHVDYSYCTIDDFEGKGEIIGELIRKLDKTGVYDFFFPLDCDEFVVAELGNETASIELEDIRSILIPLREDPRVLMIGGALNNSPLHPDHFQMARGQRKCFFARGSFRSMDMGFHVGRAVTTKETVKTSILYVHMHNRPYNSLRYFSMQKLAGRLPDFSEESLRAFQRDQGRGYHVVGALLMGESKFKARFTKRPSIHFPAFLANLAEMGTPLAFSEYPDVRLNAPKTNEAGALRGFVDSASVSGLVARVRGWGVTASGLPAKVISVRIGQHSVPEFEVKTVERPDVAKAIGTTARMAGFEAQFLLPGIPESDLRSNSLGVVLFSDEPRTAPTLISMGTHKPWPFRSSYTLPDVPDAPAISPAAIPLLVNCLRNSKCYLEYGTGGSTVMASEYQVPAIVAVDSDALWLEAVRLKLSETPVRSALHLVYVDIGPTKEWGHPTSDANWRDYHRYPIAPWLTCREHQLRPDLVFIDGRFRVASFLASLLFAVPGCRILFDDYADRKPYGEVERFVTPAGHAGGLAEFIVPQQLPKEEIWLELLREASNPA